MKWATAGRPSIRGFARADPAIPADARLTATQKAKALALREAYRRITVKDGGRALALPAIQAILRSQIALAAKGNVQAQRAVLAAIQAIEWENVVEERAAEFDTQRAARVAVQLMRQESVEAAAPAAPNARGTMSYTEAARRLTSVLRRGKAELKLKSEEEKKAESAAPTEDDKPPTAAPRATLCRPGRDDGGKPLLRPIPRGGVVS